MTPAKEVILGLWNACMMPHNIATRLGIDEEEVLSVVEDQTNYPDRDGRGVVSSPTISQPEA